ncbi:hypothetical protein AOLI_G00195550 [Acnodon oligacanthus]
MSSPPNQRATPEAHQPNRSGCYQLQSATDLSLYTQLTETNQASSTHRVPFLSPSRLARSKAGRSPDPHLGTPPPFPPTRTLRAPIWSAPLRTPGAKQIHQPTLWPLRRFMPLPCP